MMFRKYKPYIVPLVLLWVLCVSVYLAATMSMTTDEGIHMASGYMAITRADDRFDPEHPFLFKFITALPVVLFVRPKLPANTAKLWAECSPITYDCWQESRQFTDEWFYTTGNNAKEMLFVGRIGAILALLGLCYLSFYLARLWFGEKMAYWVLFFTAFNPTLLAQGSTMNDDVPLAIGFLLTLWALWLYWQKPSARQAMWVGLALAAALLIKDSGIGLLPVALIWVITMACKRKITGKEFWLHTLVTLATIWIAIWTVYFWKSPLDLSPALGDSAGVIAQIKGQVTAHHLNFTKTIQVMHYILPSEYWKGLFLSLGASHYGRPTFILGKHLGSGVWYYFPALFLLKTQVIALLLGIVGIFLAWKSSIKKWTSATNLIVLTTVIFSYFLITSKLNLGIRHMAPVLVLFSFGVAGVMVVLQERYRMHQAISALIAFFYILPVPLQLSNLLGFSNVLIWNKANTYRYFDDSNLDWGQQAEKLADYARNQLHTDAIYVNYPWNPYALSYFGLQAFAFNPAAPLNGFYAVNATEMNAAAYTRFRNEKPYYVLDSSMLIFKFANNQNLVQ